jgi:hypothetical protein
MKTWKVLPSGVGVDNHGNLKDIIISNTAIVEPRGHKMAQAC